MLVPSAIFRTLPALCPHVACTFAALGRPSASLRYIIRLIPPHIWK